MSLDWMLVLMKNGFKTQDDDPSDFKVFSFFKTNGSGIRVNVVVKYPGGFLEDPEMAIDIIPSGGIDAGYFGKIHEKHIPGRVENYLEEKGF